MKNICDASTAICPRYKELRVLYDISLSLGESPLDIERAFGEVLLLLKRHFYMSKSIFYRRNEETDELTVFTSTGLNKRQENLAVYKVGEGATGMAAKYKEPVIIDNIHKDILFLNKSRSVAENEISYIAIPAILNDRVLGVLGASLTEKSIPDMEEMVTILTVAASFMAQAIQIHKTICDEKSRLKEEKLYYKEEILRQNEFIGSSSSIRTVIDLVRKIAPSDATALIMGETGTGKELIAKAIHNNSLRKEKPYIKINCAAIPENLMESELFGHEKGAFTDAKEMRKGRFELADEGTIFLDEIGDLSLNLQVKLLRVLQEMEFERLGGMKTIKVDVRIIAATNRNLKKMVNEGTFREDLFYRLNVIPIHSPPLRTRGDDIILLADHFLEGFSKRHGKTALSITREAQEMLKAYAWPGNIRELENSMERIVLLASDDTIDCDVLLSVLPAKTEMKAQEVETRHDIEDLEKETIIRALRECKGVKLRAAKKLQMSYRQIDYKIQKYGIAKKAYETL